MKICFLDFWPSFNNNNNFFETTLKILGYNIELVDYTNADIVFYSCFGNIYLNPNRDYNKKWIFYTGENKRPDLYANINLTFDYTNEYNNFRLPLWWLYIDWFNKKTWDDPKYLIPVELLKKPLENSGEGFCCMIAGNPTESRRILFEELSKYGKVDSYGKFMNNMGLLGGNEYEKIEVLRKYKYCICPENSIWEGYNTEKYLHAWVAGCVPIYIGDPKIEKEFIGSEIFKGDLNISKPEKINLSKEEVLEKMKIIYKNI